MSNDYYATFLFIGGKKNNAMLHIGVDEVVEWMAVRSLLLDIKS